MHSLECYYTNIYLCNYQVRLIRGGNVPQINLLFCKIIDIFNSYKLIRMRGTQRLSVVKKQIIIALFSIKIGSGYVRTAFRFLYPYVGKHLLPFYIQSFCHIFFNRTEAFLVNINRGEIL